MYNIRAFSIYRRLPYFVYDSIFFNSPWLLTEDIVLYILFHKKNNSDMMR